MKTQIDFVVQAKKPLEQRWWNINAPHSTEKLALREARSIKRRDRVFGRGYEQIRVVRRTIRTTEKTIAEVA